MATARRVSKLVFYVLLLPAVIGVLGWQGWRWWNWATAPVLSRQEAAEQNVADAAIQIEIPPGTSAQQIGDDLEAAGVIRSSTAWRLWTRVQGVRDRTGGFQAGTYELSLTDPLGAIAESVWNGDVVQVSITIPEGWNIRQMGEYFEAQGLFAAEDFVAASQNVPYEDYPWLPENLPHLEGFLYPDTYTLPDPATPEAIIRQMLDQFEGVALPLYQPEQTAYSLLEWVTLASIVEKEAVVGDERGLIASVFARRLEEGMTLGADPTVEYALGIRQTPDQPLTLRDVNTPSPYNTYLNPGLPPTPIASPGVASLEASIAPADTEYLYFVARYDGTHVFSRTLAEHEAAQAQIQDGLAAQREADANSVN
jgi:UPF0755 protein